MLDVLEQKICVITLLIIFTFQSGLAVSVRPTEDPIEEAVFAGRRKAEFINRWFDVVYLYNFAFEKFSFGSSPAKKNITEFYFQESNCTRNDVNNMNKTKKACTFNQKGKIMICQIKNNTWQRNSTDCKSTGDKYDIPKTDRRSEGYAILAVEAYNEENDKPENPLILSDNVNVITALKREVSIGTKNVLQFSTPERNCTYVNETEKCSIVKRRFDCEATVNEPMTTADDSELRYSLFDSKRKVDVKCQENKSPDDVIAMRNMPPPEKKTCMRIDFNPIGKDALKIIKECMRWTDEKKPEKTAGSSMEDQKLVKPKASSAVVESSADKEGKNKTSGTMSSGSFPKKASTSKLKAKNILTKAKAKNAAMKMLEAESERADQPEEDGAYASSDKGQPPIPPIIPKKVIKKEKAFTKAGGQNTTKTKNKDSIEEDSEDAEEEAKIEKKTLSKASKASARQEKTNDGGQIVSGGKKKVKVLPEPERFLAGKEDKKSNSKPKMGSVGSAGKQKSAAAKERGKNQKKEEKEKNEDEKKHPVDEDKIIKVSEPKLKTKAGKKGSAASSKKGEKAKKEKPVLEDESKTSEKVTA